jgi:uncharacterized cysteine cluster protein YcgN (CxxCxxCC family)
VDPRAGLDRCGKCCLPPGFDPWTVQLLAQSLYRLSYPGPLMRSIFLLKSAWNDVRCLYMRSRAGGNKLPKFITEVVGSVKEKCVGVLSKWSNSNWEETVVKEKCFVF